MSKENIFNSIKNDEETMSFICNTLRSYDNIHYGQFIYDKEDMFLQVYDLKGSVILELIKDESDNYDFIIHELKGLRFSLISIIKNVVLQGIREKEYTNLIHKMIDNSDMTIEQATDILWSITEAFQITR